MNLEDTIKLVQWNYPLLYQGKHSRQKVLDHLYFTIGNGFKWNKGRLEDLFQEELVSEEEHNRRMEKASTSMRLPEELEKLLDELEEKHSQIYTFFDKSFYLYPINEFSAVCNVPDDVAIDYLFGAVEILDFAINYGIDEYRQTILESYSKAVETREEILERFGV